MSPSHRCGSRTEISLGAREHGTHRTHSRVRLRWMAADDLSLNPSSSPWKYLTILAGVKVVRP
jgi:hypothetical protein